ncbi:MAG: tetratricopeptide repeat protein, partial [Methanocorpusculum sp.]|nr:tetratricopeptide repeat protein [Methanocorpusculum sp.]
QFKVGDMLGYLGKYDEALVLYTLLASRYPLDPGLYRRMAVVYNALGRTTDAAAALAKEMELREKIVRETPTPSSLYKYADTKTRLHLWEEAEAGFRQSLNMEESADTHLRLGAVLIEQGKTDEGREEFKKAAEFDPRDFTFLMREADILTQLGMYEDAISCYTRALDLRSVHADAWAGIAYSLLRLHKYDDAKAFFAMAKASAAVRELPWADKLHKSPKTAALDTELHY